MSTIYTAAFTLLVPFLLVRLFIRGARDPDYRNRWRERFGYGLPGFAGRPAPVWIHAVSVGEAIAATPVIDYFSNHHPDVPLLVTTTTATGAATVARHFGAQVEHRYFPYDLPGVTRRYLHDVGPRMLILMETELWPNLMHSCARANVPVVVANARMSAKSARRYARFPVLTKRMLRAVTCLAAQSTADRERFLELGAGSENVIMTGSLKFDIELPASVAESGQAIRRLLGVNRAVLMAGSTRDGEEAILLDAYAKLRDQHSDLLLLIAPRHPERFEVVAELCRKSGYEFVRHSDAASYSPQCGIYLIDTMGELPGFYAASDVAFVGGSLVPCGGHNALEPAALGVPVVVGKHTYNFSDIVHLLGAAGALKEVADSTAFVEVVDYWLSHGEARDVAGAAGREIVVANRGATSKLMRTVESLLKSGP